MAIRLLKQTIRMKKFIALLIIVASAMAASVSSSAQFRRGVTLGATYNDLIFKQDLVDVKQQVGYAGGVVGELMFPGIGVGLDLGFLYNQQSAKVNLGQRKVWSSLGYGDEHVMIHTLQIPVHLKLKWTRLNGLEEKIAPMIFCGPDFNIQLGHSNASAFKCSGGDLGVTLGLGAEIYRHWQLTGAYTWGMTYVCKTKLLDDFSAKSRQWTVRLAYFF